MLFWIISFQVAHMELTGQYRAFIVEMFTKNESVTARQRTFRVYFGLGRQDPVPNRNTILLWVTNFRPTWSALKRKSIGRPRTARTPENIEAINVSIQQSSTAFDTETRRRSWPFH